MISPPLSRLSIYSNNFQPKLLCCSRRCLAIGSYHQGELDNGGRQCVCVSLAFLASQNFDYNQSFVDNILQIGTSLYTRICLHGGYLLVTELPDEVLINDTHIKLVLHHSRSGMILSKLDEPKALTFTLSSALQKCFQEEKTCFFTVGNSPAYTIGICHIDTRYTTMDSHSRNRRGRSSPDGKAVIIEVPSLNDLVQYLVDLSNSLSDNDLPFEVTAAKITYR